MGVVYRGRIDTLSPTPTSRHVSTPAEPAEQVRPLLLLTGLLAASSLVTGSIGSLFSGAIHDLSTGATFAYGEAERAGGDSLVVERAWDVKASVDRGPYARLSPFAFGPGMHPCRCPTTAGRGWR